MTSNLRTVVLDNGGGKIKAGYAGDSDPSILMHNVAARIKRQQRVLVGNEIDTKIKDHSQLQYVRPVDRGFVTDFSAQSLLWEKLMGNEYLNRRPEDTTLVCTTAPFAPVTLQRGFDELVFETVGFRAYNRSIPAQWLACSLSQNVTTSASQAGAMANQSTGAGAGRNLQKVYDVKGKSTQPSAPEWLKVVAPSVPRLSSCTLPVLSHGTGIIVDVGYSFTTITPMHAWKVIPEGIRRMPIGGKILTNALKEVLSYRQFNVMDDPWLVDRIKESLCYTALNFSLEHALAMRMKGIPTAPPALAKVMARAAGRLEKSSSGGLNQNAPMPGPSWSREAVTSIVHRVKERVGGGGGSAHGKQGAARYATGTDRNMQQPPKPQVFEDAANLADLVPAVSAPSVRPQTGSDGSGVGVTRQFMLPDYMHVQVGYVLGSQADPMRALALLQGTAAAPVEEGSATTAATTTGAATVAAAGAAAVSSQSTVDGQAKRKKEKQGEKEQEAGTSAKRQKLDSARSSNQKGEGIAGSAHKKKKKDQTMQHRKKGQGGEKDQEEGEGDDDDEGNDSSSISSEEDEEDEDEEEPVAAAAAAKKDSEYKASTSEAPVARRQSSARASKAGVAALTSTLRRGGLLAEGDEDEDAGGAIEGSNRLPLGVSAAAMSSLGFASGASGGAGAGQAAADAQVMTIGVERFAVPEALFRPTDIGIDSVGLHEAVMSAVYACPRYLWQALLASVVVVGGTAKLPGLETRLKRELQAVAPAGAPVGLYTPSDPVVAVWRGGSIFGSRPDLSSVVVTKEEYMEHGWERINTKFNLQTGPAAYHLQDSEELERIAAAIKAKQAAAAAAAAASALGQGMARGLEAWDAPADEWEDGEGDDDAADEDY